MTRASQFHNNTWYLSLPRTNNYQNNDVIFPFQIDKFVEKKEEKKLTLSNPALSSRLPSVSPTPARSVTGFSPMGSATKFLCFCDVLDIVVYWACWFSWNLKTFFNETLNVGWTLFDGQQDVNRFFFSTSHTAETLLAWMTHKLIIKK